MKKTIYINLMTAFIILFIIGTLHNPNNNSEYNHENENQLQKIKHQFNNNKQNKRLLNENSIDVLAIGNSSLYSALNPLQLWHEQGITSYSAAGPSLHISTSFSILKECLTVQRPKVLILEVSNFFETKKAGNMAQNKVLALKYSYPLFEETQRWNEVKNLPIIKRTDFGNHMYYKGYYYNNKVKANQNQYSYMKPTDAREKLLTETKIYLLQIIKLAREYNCQILFGCFPCSTAWTYKKHNIINDISKMTKIPFIDFNTETLLTNFNWKNGTRDGGDHLNATGAYEMTKYLGEYLNQHYSLEDYRQNKLFVKWERLYQSFNSKKN